MDDYKWHQIKQNYAKNKKLIIGTALFLLVGVCAFIIGAVVNGENPIEWFTSPFAITIYILVGLALIGLGVIGAIIFIKKQ